MNATQYTGKIKSLSRLQQDNHKKAFVHLIALHTGNKPDAIEHSLKEKDGFAEKKIRALHPKVLSQVFQSALIHGNLKGGK